MSELDPPVDTPITVAASAVPDQVMGAVRQALVGVSGYLIGKGWLDKDLAAALLPAATLLLPVLWSQLTIRRSNAVKVTMANMLPDAKARVA